MNTLRRPLLLLASVLAGCASSANQSDAGREIATRLDGGDNAIAISPPFAYEGQRRFVGAVGPALEGDDLSMATITAPAESGVVVERVQCTRLRCAFVAHIEDRIPNRGAPIPDVTSAVRYTVTVVGARYNYTASLRVFPLDAADAAVLGASTVATQAVYSTMSIPTGAMLRGSSLDLPIRLAVMAGAELHGTFDLSAEGATAGPGGYEGGMAPAGDGQGPLPGRGATTAGGGAGHAMVGGDGRGEGGAAGGAGGMAAMDRTIFPFRGGSGGGAGGGGNGGGGAGAMVLAVYGTSSFDGARFLARGGRGAGAGGGGAGGAFILAGAPVGGFIVDVGGGAGGTQGGARGGDGSPGRVRLDGAMMGAHVAAGSSLTGVRFDVDAIPPITRTADFEVRGFAAPNTRVLVQNEYGGTLIAREQTTADAEGRWSVTFRLSPGPASFIAYDASGSTPVPSFSGTRVVIRSPAGAPGPNEIFAGAVDVVYLPESD